MDVVEQFTGSTVSLPIYGDRYEDVSLDSHWRITQSQTYIDHLTVFKLPTVFLSVEDTARASDLSTVISDYVKAETAKFIVGTRSLDEFDAYQEELKALNIEEYIELYREAYSTSLEAVFGK